MICFEGKIMLTIICGLTGKGKTALATELGVEKMMNSMEDYRNSYMEVLKLKAGGFDKLSLPQTRHLVYSDYPIKVNPIYRTYKVDGYEIGLPNIFFNIAFLPPYSTIILDEAQKYFDSRSTKYLREEVYRWFQLHRHNHYNVILTCQRIGNIDINIRALADRVIVCEGIDVKEDSYGVADKITWNVREFLSAEVAEQYCLKKEQGDYCNYGKMEKITSKYPIFNYYNSYGNKPVFYYMNENRNYDYYTEDGYVFTKESFVNFNNEHYFVCPQGYLKNPDYDKKILKKYGVL